MRILALGFSNENMRVSNEYIGVSNSTPMMMLSPWLPNTKEILILQMPPEPAK